jgi:glycosyltransferase involved in cell wall biosynthesis
MTPRVTVLVTAYRRQKFVIEAVRSVLGSKVARDSFEILLVIDEIDQELAATLRDLGVTILIVDSVRGGEMWVEGIRAAKGQVIAFLDDDDCFFPNKLARVLEIFSDPEVVWYHNGFRRVDESRQPLTSSSEHTESPRVYRAPLSRDDLGMIRRAGGFYNNSSHSVRRAALLPNLNAFLEVTFGQDFAIPTLLSGSGKVVIDLTNVQTEFRTHWSQGSQPYSGNKMPESHVRFLRGIVGTFYWLSKSAPSVAARSFALCRAQSYEALLWTTRRESVAESSGAFRRTLQAVRGNLSERDWFHTAVLCFLLTLSFVSLSATESAYVALKRVEMRGIGLELPSGRPSSSKPSG